MDQHSIKNVNPAGRLDAVNKANAGRIKYKTTTGIIPHITMTDSSHFPLRKLLPVER